MNVECGRMMDHHGLEQQTQGPFPWRILRCNEQTIVSHLRVCTIPSLCDGQVSDKRSGAASLWCYRGGYLPEVRQQKCTTDETCPSKCDDSIPTKASQPERIRTELSQNPPGNQAGIHGEGLISSILGFLVLPISKVKKNVSEENSAGHRNWFW